MKLSEAKRRIKVGTKIQAIGHYNPKATGTRTVTKVQTNGFWYECENIKRCWCPWPAARFTQSAGPDSIVLLLNDGKPMSTLVLETESS